jgi:hypothetical protein
MAAPTTATTTQSIPRKRGSLELNAALTPTEEKTDAAFKPEVPTKPENKCQYSTCNSNLTPAMRKVKCACERAFCARHRPFQAHGCTISWREFDAKRSANARNASQNGFTDHDGGHGVA